MSQVEHATSSYKTPMHHRILANMPVQASWIDSVSGETITIEGMTDASQSRNLAAGRQRGPSSTYGRR